MTPPALVRVRMARRGLADIPARGLPEGFECRAYRSGDIDTWLRVVRAADLHSTVDEALYRRTFGSDEARLEARQLFLEHGGGVIGTGTAWYADEDPEGAMGRVHWLALAPAWQGLGLGGALLSAVLARLRALGHTSVMLMTETVRVRAIQLYLRFGFEPEVRSAADRAAWAGLAEVASEWASRIRARLEREP